MTEPLISIIIPAYNEEARIARCIKSIQDQTYKNLEIIVVDDYSKDNTASEIKKIALEDSRVKYYLVPGGAPKRKNWRGYDINAGWKARAYGFSIARGGWITTQDADDASLLNRIEVQYNLANKYNATLVTVHWQQPTANSLGKKLDVDRLFSEVNEKDIIVPNNVINPIANKNLGLFTKLPFHHLIPFPIKWFPYTRKLFYGKNLPYPGADNCMFFRKEVIACGINFRSRNKRTWGTPSGRGSGRDFAFQVSYKFKNSWSFYLPLYLWDVNIKNPDVPDYADYII